MSISDVPFPYDRESTSQSAQRSRQLPPLSDSVVFRGKLNVQVSRNVATAQIPLELHGRSKRQLSFVLHWGCYGDYQGHWQDIRIRPRDVFKQNDGTFLLETSFPVQRRGDYGATLYAEDRESGEQVWQGSGAEDDAKFRIDQDCPELLDQLMLSRINNRKRAERVLFDRIGSFDEFEQTVRELRTRGPRSEVARILFDFSKNNENLRELLADYYQSGKPAGQQPSNARKSVHAVLENIGIGELVMVAPEGPHAIAGGLAQVMNGLLSSFAETGLSVTLISMLYEHPQGNKHRSAEEVLRNGIQVGKERLMPRHAGEVDIPFGPTCAPGTAHWKDHPFEARANVYIAEGRNTKLVLLRNAYFSDYLYPHALADGQLRRAIFLSRGALEILKNPIFGVNPQIILSNDWLTALVPVFHKLDPRYHEHEVLARCKTIHLIHNCGRDYHGLIPTNFNGTDLYPLLGLDPFHYGGLADPHNRATINLTAAAIYHLNGALVTVSKPYARQLLTWEGGEGLHDLLWNRRERVFGISNGVDQKSLRSTIAEIGIKNCTKLDEKASRRRNGGLDYFVSQLPLYKQCTKRLLQRHEGLEEDPDKIILTFLGRIAEQKGVQLLSGWAAGDGCSVMESVLNRYPNVQIVVAGPVVEGDACARHFRGVAEHLRWRYPGRVAVMLDFIPHHYSLEILTASDFALMPSRFEPGGLIQLEALTCGTLVIARNVGGIAATLTPINEHSTAGNSFLFDEFSPMALRDTICYALNKTVDADFRTALTRQAALSEHDWRDRVPQYRALFQHLTGVLNAKNTYPHIEQTIPLIEHLRA